MGNAGSRGFQDGVVSKKEMERMHRRSGPAGNNDLCVYHICDVLCKYKALGRGLLLVVLE